MKSNSLVLSSIDLPLIDGEYSMIPFDLNTLEGLSDEFKVVANKMLSRFNSISGTGFFTIHGKKLKKNGTLRRGGPHTDGNYEPHSMTFGGTGGGSGWKVGESGPEVNSELHRRQYNKETGGILLASNYESCLGWNGEYEGLPSKGGDCSKINLDEPFILSKNKVYYGNNHFIHESLPVDKDVHRVMVRITLPEDHEFKESLAG